MIKSKNFNSSNINKKSNFNKFLNIFLLILSLLYFFLGNGKDIEKLGNGYVFVYEIYNSNHNKFTYFNIFNQTNIVSNLNRYNFDESYIVFRYKKDENEKFGIINIIDKTEYLNLNENQYNNLRIKFGISYFNNITLISKFLSIKFITIFSTLTIFLILAQILIYYFKMIFEELFIFYYFIKKSFFWFLIVHFISFLSI